MSCAWVATSPRGEENQRPSFSTRSRANRGCRSYGLDPTARSRLNALLLGTMFVGMSVGSALGSIALDRFGWRGVGVFGAVAAAAALLLRLRRHKG